MKNLFGFLKSSTEFLNILILFVVMMMLLYWISALQGTSWAWMNFIKPLLDAILNIASSLTDKAIAFKDFSLEFKYPVAVAILLVLSILPNYLKSFLENLEDKCDDANRAIKHSRENRLNKQLKQVQTNSQKKITNYRIFISTELKKKFSHAELGYNLEEQNIIMNKFLIEKLGSAPVKYNDGFLFKFSNFEDIDQILVHLFKLIKSNSPLDYVICVQLSEGNEIFEDKLLKYLADLKIANKISMLSDVAYRYKFNNAHRYGTSQIGIFQKENDSLEVHEFIEIS